MNNRVFRILVCPNAFKGSLSAIDAACAIGAGFERANRSNETSAANHKLEFAVDETPLADGGDGTLETLVAVTNGSINRITVRGPRGDLITAPWGRLGGSQSETAVIEMAKASGLALLPPERYDPLHSTTAGTGELMLAAVGAGCTHLLVGIGGSATNDGGSGMAAALGARLLDSEGKPVPPGGIGLELLSTIDTTGWKLPAGIEVVVACDVNNPLTGEFGASAVYGPQKGATPEMVGRLDAALGRYGRVLESTFGADISTLPGSGAAGGLGAGLRAFCGARLAPGAEMVLDAVEFEAKLAACDVVVTGEGILDAQTARGKLIAVVAGRALAAGKPCIALAGSIAGRADEMLRPLGLTTAFCIADGPMDLDTAMLNGSRLLSDSAERLAMLLQSLTR